MRRWLFVLPLLLGWSLAARALPELELDVKLDPATRQFNATATLSDAAGLSGFRLGPDFEIMAMKVNGQTSQPSRRLASPEKAISFGHADFSLPRGTRRVEVTYRATLKPLQALDHRQVLGYRAGAADPEGSFLPGAAGWYPQVASLFSYRLTLRLPAGQKGLVPGNLTNETDTAAGYRARFEFPHPADGIDLMAGPYAVSERSLKLAGGQDIHIRTWFHAELAPLAQGYLDDSARYIERYSQLIGAYPFALFSVVSSPTPTGFGMPSLTYLGRDVIKLPFIRATSLGHEVLHNWWGNGVYPDWQKGNWSEGLTTFLADYAFKEAESADAAREMRLAWLRDYAAVPAGAETALKDFTSRHHGISSIVGYNKAAMVFLMLRDEIGQPAFERGLRLFWEKKRFQTAAWSDLDAAFSEAAQRSLSGFFRQWVERAGAPELQLKAAEQGGDTLTLHLNRPAYALELPLRLNFADRSEMRTAPLRGDTVRLPLKVSGSIQSVELDPDYRLWRRVDSALLPAILREVFVAPTAAVVAIDAEMGSAAQGLAARVLDAKAAPLMAERPAGRPVLVIGRPSAIDDWLKKQALPPRPAVLTPESNNASAQVWAGRDGSGIPYVVVAARDAAAVTALERGLPHYGKQSWLVFDGARATGKGVGAPLAAPVKVSVAPVR